MFRAASVGKVWCAFRSTVHMQMANSAVTQVRADGMGHPPGFPAAAVGKLRGSKAKPTADTVAVIRRLIFAVVALFVATVSGSASYAQSGPFAGMAGNWSGGGTVALDDGSTERIRCRATYAIGAGGTGLNLTLVCASDSYKFDLKGNIIADRGGLTGNWSEASRNINGTLEGRGAGGNFQVLATAAGFAAQLTLTTRGNRQSVVITPQQAGFKGATIALS